MIRWWWAVLGLAVAGAAGSATPYEARTLKFAATPTAEGKVLFLWEGEISNSTVSKETLCAVVQLLDDTGKVVKELETKAFNVDRFGKLQVKETFPVDGDVWKRTDAVEPLARATDQEPSNGPRLHKVELYTTNWCPWCKKARDYFVSRGIEFEDFDVERDPEAARRKSQLDGGKRGVPFALIDGKGVHGYSEKAYDEALRAGEARAGQGKGR